MYQGLFLTNNVTFIAINGWVGFSLAPLGWMAAGSFAAAELALPSFQEKDRAQAALNFSVFAVTALTALASGALVITQGWAWLNAGSLPVLVLAATALGWLALQQRKPRV